MATPEKKTKFSKKILAAIIILIVIVSVSVVVAEYSFLQNSEPQKSTQLSAISLLLVGSDGQTKTLNETDIAALESYTGSGGIRSHGNQISGVGTYTGVPVLTLVNLVGGIKSGETVTATATDNYTFTYDYNAVVNGQGFTTYDTSGSQKDAEQPLKLVLTYYYQGTVLSSEQGPLRMGILGSEGLVTQGNQWEKWVIKLQVNPADSPSPTSSSNMSPTPTPAATAAPTGAPTATPTSSPSVTPTPTPTNTASNVLLTVVAANGSKVTFTSDQLHALTSVSYAGGTKSGNGGLANYGVYTGVSLLTILSLAGGLTSSNTVQVTASDSYTTTYTYSQVNGQDIPMYDQNQNSVTPTQPVTLLVAYSLNGTALAHATSDDPGPLRIIAVGPNGYYMQGNLSPRMVVKIEIL